MLLRLLLFWITGLRATFVSNPNFVLYDRLMNNYRIDFVQTDDSCNRTEWETNKADVPSVPRDKLENELSAFSTLIEITTWNISDCS